MCYQWGEFICIASLFSVYRSRCDNCKPLFFKILLRSMCSGAVPVGRKLLKLAWHGRVDIMLHIYRTLIFVIPDFFMQLNSLWSDKRVTVTSPAWMAWPHCVSDRLNNFTVMSLKLHIITGWSRIVILYTFLRSHFALMSPLPQVSVWICLK